MNSVELPPKTSAIFDIREPLLEEAGQIERIVNSAYWMVKEPFFVNNDETRKRTTIERVVSIIQTSKGCQKLFVLVDRVQNILIGTILLEWQDASDEARFSLFAIDPDHRKQRIGSSLMSHVEAYAQTIGKVRMVIEVFSFAETLSQYYQEKGYQPTGIVKPFKPLGNYVLPQFFRPNHEYLIELKKDL